MRMVAFEKRLVNDVRKIELASVWSEGNLYNTGVRRVRTLMGEEERSGAIGKVEKASF